MPELHRTKLQWKCCHAGSYLLSSHFVKEQCCSCTDREKKSPPAHRECCWRGRDRDLDRDLPPIIHTTPGMPWERSPGTLQSCAPKEAFGCIAHAAKCMFCSTPGRHSSEAHGQLEICPALSWSQGHRKHGPGLSVGLGRRHCASPSFGLVKTSLTSETLHAAH